MKAGRTLNKEPREVKVGRSGGVEFRGVLLNLLLLTGGSAIYAIGVNGVLTPHNFLSGGVLGVCLTVHYLFPLLSVGLLYTAFNIPLFCLGWFHLGKGFIIYTVFGVAVFSFWTEVLTIRPFPVQNPLLAAIFAGIVCGIGNGIMLRSAGSPGGLDILSVFLNRKFEIRVGLTSVIANAFVLTTGALLFNLEMALFSFVFVIVQSRLIDAVLTGFNQRKSLIIISDKSTQLAEAILTKLQRGVTFLEGSGAYSGSKKQVILCVISLMELGKMKHLINSIDPHAFVIINDTLGILGTMRPGSLLKFDPFHRGHEHAKVLPAGPNTPATDRQSRKDRKRPVKKIVFVTKHHGQEPAGEGENSDKQDRRESGREEPERDV